MYIHYEYTPERVKVNLAIVFKALHNVTTAILSIHILIALRRIRVWFNLAYSVRISSSELSYPFVALYTRKLFPLTIVK